MFIYIYIHAVDYTILTDLDEDINILICSALLVCLPEHKHRAVWLQKILSLRAWVLATSILSLMV